MRVAKVLRLALTQLAPRVLRESVRSGEAIKPNALNPHADQRCKATSQTHNRHKKHTIRSL